MYWMMVSGSEREEAVRLKNVEDVCWGRSGAYEIRVPHSSHPLWCHKFI
jgi:hypothetical protein